MWLYICANSLYLSGADFNLASQLQRPPRQKVEGSKILKGLAIIYSIMPHSILLWGGKVSISHYAM